MMSDTLNRFATVICLLALGQLLLSVAGCKGGGEPVDPGDPQAYLDASGINGGRLYDKFWASETGWNQADPNYAVYNDHADFFRCKQCHGWDLLGSQGAYISRAPKTTRPNVSSLNLRTIAAGMTPQELFDALKSSTGRRALTADLSTYDPATNSTTGDQMPDYGSFMTDAQLWDLVKFLKATAVDTGLLYDSTASGTYPTGSMAFANIGKDGDAANGSIVFTAKCVGCHGTDGRAILVDGDEFSIGSFVRAKPNEAQHKMKYGQLGSAMGSLVTDTGEMKDVFKALADPVAFPDPEPEPEDPQGFLDADGIVGGKLYDKFWSADAGWDQDDPNYDVYNDHADFFRCKQCHGWDLLGSAGAYISRAPSATRPNVSGLNLLTLAAGMTPQELFDALKSSAGRRALTADLSTYDPDTNATTGDQMPDYGSFMSDGDIWNLVKFLKTEAVDAADLYSSVTTGTYPTGSIDFTDIGLDGDAASGDAIYAAKCIACHGADGAAILVDGGEFTVGSFIRAKPHEAQHKIKFGQLGSIMGSQVTDLQDLKDLYKALTDTATYPDPT